MASTTKSVVIVGVSHSPGLGFAIARKFAREGHAVGILGRHEERLEACKAQILEEISTAQIIGVQADCSKEEEVKNAFGILRAEHGAPDCLVFNMASRPFPPTSIGETSLARLEADWKAGPFAALMCVKEVLPSMRSSGSGTILFTGASASLRGSKNFGSFAVSKCGLRAMAQSLAREEARNGVHVAHIIVDALVDMPVVNKFIEQGMLEATPGRLLDTDFGADVYWQLYSQDKRCWTFEIDIRPSFAEF